MPSEVNIVVKSTDSASKGFDKIGSAATGMNSAIEAAGNALDSIDAIQQSGTQKSEKLARAHLDVEQAMIDNEQAVVDLKQATLDLNQAELDGKQAAVDVEQAQIDQKQANLDATVAQKEYNKAVKEHGKNSEEAKQAAIDLTQARTDSKQADVDAEQAVADLAQAQSDSKQATTDLKQASVDAKTAQLDLNEAQRAVDPTFIQNLSTKFQELAPILGVVTLAAQAAASGLNATKIAAIASAAATKAMAVAQWILNAALTANPIGLVIAAIAALTIGLVIAYRRSATFRAIVQNAFKIVAIQGRLLWSALSTYFRLIGAAMQIASRVAQSVASRVRSIWSGLISFIRSIPGRVRGALSGMFNPIINAARRALGTARSLLGQLINYARSIPSQIGNSIKNAIPGFAHGGVVGQAASGGGRGGLTMTGEHGPELLNLPPGTRVRSNPDSRRAISSSSSGGGERVIRLVVEGTGLLKGLRETIRLEGGDVQAVLGR